MLVSEPSGNEAQERVLEEQGDYSSPRRARSPSSIEGEALEALLRAHRGRIHGLCCRYTGGNAADAEDLVQEAYLRAYRGIGSFRGDSRFSTWLYRIAVNVCLSWVSSRTPRTVALSDGLELEAPGPTPSKGLENRQAVAAVRHAVAKLPERQRMTLILRIYDELSHREIAEIMGGSVGTAKANLFFALKNLRKLLGERP